MIQLRSITSRGGGGVPPGAQPRVQQGSKRNSDHSRRLIPGDEQTEMASVIAVNSAATKRVKDVAGDRSEGMTMIKIIVAIQVSKEAFGRDWTRNSIAVERILDSCERRSHMPDKRIDSGAA
jgi:hypothetical protein